VLAVTITKRRMVSERRIIAILNLTIYILKLTDEYQDKYYEFLLAFRTSANSIQKNKVEKIELKEL
jgi:hypothetical protein